MNSKIVLATAVALTLTASVFATAGVPAPQPPLTENYGVLVKILASKELKTAMIGKSFLELSMDEKVEGLATTYTVYLTTKVAGLGLNGGSSRPCHISATAQTMPSIKGIKMTKPVVRLVCAENMPR